MKITKLICSLILWVFIFMNPGCASRPEPAAESAAAEADDREEYFRRRSSALQGPEVPLLSLQRARENKGGGARVLLRWRGFGERRLVNDGFSSSVGWIIEAEDPETGERVQLALHDSERGAYENALSKLSTKICELRLEAISNSPEAVGRIIDWRSYQGERPGALWQGPRETYNRAGVLIERASFKDGLREGPAELFWESGAIKSRGPFSQDKKTGNWQELYTDGTLASEGAFEKGHKNGLWRSYFESGAIQREESFANNQANGSFTSYWPEGPIREKGSYKNGLRDGLWEQFDSSSKIRRREHFKAGERDGLLQIWDREGELIQEQQWKDGQRLKN